MAFKDGEAAPSAGSFVGVRLLPVKQEMKLAQTSGTKSGDKNSIALVDHSVIKVSYGGCGLSSVLHLHSPFKTLFL